MRQIREEPVKETQRDLIYFFLICQKCTIYQFFFNTVFFSYYWILMDGLYIHVNCMSMYIISLLNFSI